METEGSGNVSSVRFFLFLHYFHFGTSPNWALNDENNVSRRHPRHGLWCIFTNASTNREIRIFCVAKKNVKERYSSKVIAKESLIVGFIYCYFFFFSFFIFLSVPLILSTLCFTILSIGEIIGVFCIFGGGRGGGFGFGTGTCLWKLIIRFTKLFFITINK